MDKDDYREIERELYSIERALSSINGEMRRHLKKLIVQEQLQTELFTRLCEIVGMTRSARTTVEGAKEELQSLLKYESLTDEKLFQ